MKASIRELRRLLCDERGLETIEYAVMTALIIAAMILAITALSTAISNRFGKVQNTVSTVN